MKNYNLEEFRNDPRTHANRAVLTLFECIDENKISHEYISAQILKKYYTGKHRSPSYIKHEIKNALILLQKFQLESPLV